MAIELRPDEHYTVIGITGSGKSTFLKGRLVPTLLKDKDSYFVIVDIKNEWHIKGEKVVQSPVDLNDALYAKDKPIAKVIRVVPFDDATQPYAEELLRAAWTPYTRNLRQKGRYEPTFTVRVLLDDASAWYQETGGRGGEDFLRRYATLGRALRRSLLVVTQRGQIIPKIILTQSSMLIAFRMAPYDIVNTIEKQFDKKTANAIRALPKYGYAILSDELDNFVEVYNAVKKPAKTPERPKGVELSGA